MVIAKGLAPALAGQGRAPASTEPAMVIAGGNGARPGRGLVRVELQRSRRW